MCCLTLSLLELQSRFGDTPLKFKVVCPELSPKRDCSPKRDAGSWHLRAYDSYQKIFRCVSFRHLVPVACTYIFYSYSDYLPCRNMMGIKDTYLQSLPCEQQYVRVGSTRCIFSKNNDSTSLRTRGIYLSTTTVNTTQMSRFSRLVGRRDF